MTHTAWRICITKTRMQIVCTIYLHELLFLRIHQAQANSALQKNMRRINRDVRGMSKCEYVKQLFA